MASFFINPPFNMIIVRNCLPSSKSPDFVILNWLQWLYPLYNLHYSTFRKWHCKRVPLKMCISLAHTEGVIRCSGIFSPSQTVWSIVCMRNSGNLKLLKNCTGCIRILQHYHNLHTVVLHASAGLEKVATRRPAVGGTTFCTQRRIRRCVVWGYNKTNKDFDAVRE